jgi:hypothetical protein
LIFPVEFVVRWSSGGGSARKEKNNTDSREYVPGSWNMTTTSSRDTWTSARGVTNTDEGVRGRKRRNTALYTLRAVTNGGLEAGERVLRETSGSLGHD